MFLLILQCPLSSGAVDDLNVKIDAFFLLLYSCCLGNVVVLAILFVFEDRCNEAWWKYYCF